MRRLTLMVLLLVDCGGKSPAPLSPAPDRTLLDAARAGRVALEADRPAEAERQYRHALARARERDEPAAIGETGTGLAAALLEGGKPREALAVAREVGTELVRRGEVSPPAIGLASAIALHRLGDTVGADAAALGVTARAREDADAARRAWFLRGLIAAERGDAAALATAREAVGALEAPAFRADAAELAAWAALLAGDPSAAGAAAMRAATARRESLDYHSLSRALALAAEAAERQGAAAEAADLFLRAGRGAAQRKETATARRWLARAQTLGHRAGQPATAEAAKMALAGIRDE